MATFFGEVVAAPSRAGVDDEEDDELAAAERQETAEDREIRLELQKKREVHILWNTTSSASTESSTNEQQFPCSKFILGIGHNAVAFLTSFVLNSESWEVVGHAKLWNERCRTSHTTNVLPTESFCLFYRLISDPTVLLCQCSCFVAEDQQFQWLEKVFGCLQKTDLQVLVLSTCSITDYKTPESTLTLPSPFLKALKTKEFKDKVCCSLLEQPNIVRDLPAAAGKIWNSQNSLREQLDPKDAVAMPKDGYNNIYTSLASLVPKVVGHDLPLVLSYCQVWQIPAVLYQCYTDVIKLDTVTIEAFQPVLASKILKSLVKDVSRSMEILTKLRVTTTEVHNIYT